MMALYARRRRLAYYKLNQAIHSQIVRLAHNAELAAVHDVLQARMKRVRFIGHEGPGQWAAAVAEHEEMMAALSARDAAALSEVLRRHLVNTEKRVANAL
jgi:DNA-binding GntR family transcriptional regulator